MNAAALRHRVISQNLANVNTPGYTRLDVDFEESLAAAMQQGDEQALAGLVPEIVADEAAPRRADGNNVDADRELGHLNKNTLLFEMYTQLVRSQFDSMRRAVEGPQ